MKTIMTTCAAVMLTALGLGLTGCRTGSNDLVGEALQAGASGAAARSEALILREGDILKITFPGSPNLDTTQQIRRDGKITLQLVGEITAAGIAPSDLEKEVAKAYGSQLVSKEVSVTVVSSTIAVYVTGAVLHPQKVMADHPISALEAIMESGGFDYAKADLKDVRVIRYEQGAQHTYFLNLKRVMQGQQSEPFHLKPFDIIYVPERFSMF